MKQRHQRVDVVALEGVDVAPEQLGVGLVQRPGSRFGGQGAERRPRPLQGAVDRRHRGVQQLGSLRRLPAQHLAQDERGTLAGGKVLEGGDEGEAHRLPVGRDLRRVDAVGADAGVGDGCHPPGLGQ